MPIFEEGTGRRYLIMSGERGERERVERREEEEEREELIINVNNQLPKNSLSKQTYIHKSLAFPNRDDIVALLQDLDVIAKRDGWSFSHLATVAFQEFRQHHPLPNPQAQIDRMLDIQMPHKSVSQCCVGVCKRKAIQLLTLKNFEGKTQQFQVCEGHKNWRHPKYKFLLNYREMHK